VSNLTAFKEEIEQLSGLKVNIKINDNRSTLLSVKKEKERLKLSIHRMFLQAPRNVMDALSCYIYKEEKTLPQEVRTFIDQTIPAFDYSHRLQQQQLEPLGHYFDLKKVFNDVNQKYFNNELNLNVTWFGDREMQSKCQAIFGLYMESLRLVKIHRRLDKEDVPYYVVNFIMYHEMLHHVCRPDRERNGVRRVHTEAFHQKEKEHAYYTLAKQWIQQNIDRFFYYGRAQ
jgi:hypothetical protein